MKLSRSRARNLPLPAPERTPAGYAIEFGGYLAEAAAEYVKQVNATYGAATITEEPDWTPLTEAYKALQSAIYEFRKRAGRLA